MLENVSWYAGWVATTAGGLMTAYPTLLPREIGLLVAMVGIVLLLIKVRKGVSATIHEVGSWMRYYLSGPWPDYRGWDAADKFELHQAACLWCDKEPTLPMPRIAKRFYDQLIAAARKDQIKLYYRNTKEIVAAAVEQHSQEWVRDSAFNVHSEIERGELVRLANHIGVRPRFLFKDARGA